MGPPGAPPDLDCLPQILYKEYWSHCGCGVQAKRARHIGTFSDPLEAAHAYDEEAARMQGATPNFPPASTKQAADQSAYAPAAVARKR